MNCPIEIREARGVRTLHFGSDWVQGAMRLSRTCALELVYTRDMMAALLLSPRWPKLPQSILQIGLGAASIARFIDAYLPEARQTIVEIEASVVLAAQQFFNLPQESDRFQVEIAEGAQWLSSTSECFDLILVDGFDAEGNTGHLQQLAFYQQCRKQLSAGGLLVVNLLSRSPNFLTTCLALDQAFAGLTRLLPQSPGGNVIGLAAKDATVVLDATMLQERTAVLQTQTGLDLTLLIDRLAAAGDIPLGID